MNGSENPTPEPRPAASLTGSLLARRGGARPAMRRQPMASPLAVVPAHEDLGWNDMGDEEPVVAMVQEPVGQEAVADDVIVEKVTPPSSPITEQLAVLARRIKAMPAKKAARAQPATLTRAGRKAAFTLRIDVERHLRLRLLSAMTRRSAQQLLTDALDTLIAQNEQLRELADQVEAGQAATAATMAKGS